MTGHVNRQTVVNWNFVKMISVKTKIIFSYVVGDGNVWSQTISVRCIRLSISSLNILLVITTFMDFISNFNADIIRAVTSLTGSLITAIWTINYWHLLINCEQFHSNFDDIENTICESEWLAKRRLWMKNKCFASCFSTGTQKNSTIYAETEQRIKLYLNIFGKALLVPVVMSFAPFLIAGYRWHMGDYSIDDWLYFVRVW